MARTTNLTAPLRLLPTLRRHRFLLGQLAWRAFAARHAGSYLGWLWTPISTLIQFALFMVVFSVILEIKIEGLGIDLARRPTVGFGVFLITGLVPFLALSDAVVRAARVFRSNVSLVQRVRLPAEVLVLGEILGTLMHHALSFVVVVGICLWRGHMNLAGLPWVGLAVGLFLIWIVGLALAASVLGAFLPDVPEVLGLGFQIMFYGAQIVYSLSMIGGDVLRTVIQLNPLTSMLAVARAGLLGAAPPHLVTIVALVAIGVLLVVVGSVALDRWRFSIPDLL